jgi:pimeloyl-ACP methyl ester carboxylesterase
MSASPRFVLVRGLAREAGHWGRFDRELLDRWPDATIEHCDLPGNGEHWREPSPIDTADMAARLRERVWATSERAPILLAISLGAMVCLDWRQRWPTDALAGVVAINTSAGRLCRPWQRMQPPALLKTLRSLAEPNPVARELAILALTTTQHGHDTTLAERHAALHAARPIARHNVLRQMLAAARFRARAEPLAVPLLLLCSAGDRMVDPACSRILARALAGELAVHPNAGHDLPLDDPHWCVERMATWRNCHALAGCSDRVTHSKP